MPKHSSKNPNEVDWNGLLAAGSIIGNILQAANGLELQKNLDLKKAEAQSFSNQAKIIKAQFLALKNAYEGLKEKVRTLEDINAQLNSELAKKNKKIQEMEEKTKKQKESGK